MDIFLHNQNGSVMPNKINSHFLVLRIHTDPYSTFNDCLKKMFFNSPFDGIEVQQGQLHLAMMSQVSLS